MKDNTGLSALILLFGSDRLQDDDFQTSAFELLLEKEKHMRDEHGKTAFDYI